MKKQKRILSFVIAACMTVGCVAVFPTDTASAVTKQEIANLKAESDSIGDQISDVQSELDELASREARSLEEKALLDTQCALIEEQIAVTEEQIAEYEGLIDQAKIDYDQAVADEKEQYILMCDRIRCMEENGTISYLEILFGATDFTDFLSRLDFISEITEYDQQVVEDYQNLQEELLERRAELNGLLEESEQTKVALSDQQAELENKLAEAEELIAQIHADQNAQQALLDELSKAEEELERDIANAEQEYERQQQQQPSVSGGGASAGDVSFIWPVSSRKINSYFGYRPSSATNGVGSTNHAGIDIGGVGYTTPVVASAGGVVTVSQYSRSAGNYVMVSHGGGVSTVYMHMSSRSVSVGDNVSQGQQLGVTGNTGNSTGPHLHFGIRINGSYVNPMNYLP